MGANPFDRFDEANPFDQFDEKEPTSAPDPAKSGGVGEFVADLGKRAAGAVVSGLASIPEAMQSGLRATVRSGASAEPATIMPAGAFIPGVDTDESIAGVATQQERDRQELNAERMAAGVRVPGAGALARAGRGAQQAINDTASQATKDAVANSQITGNLLKGEIDFGKDPSARGFLMQGADVFGSMLPVVATALATRSPGAAGAVGGAMAGGEGVENARVFIAKQSDEQLLEHSPLFKRMVDAGASPAEARQIVSARAEDTSALLQGAVAAAGDRFTGRLVTGGLDPLIGRMAGKSIAGRTAAGAGVSAVEEGMQELSEGVASDLGTASVAGNKEIGEDSAANFVLGAIGGSAPGAGRGLASGIQARRGAEQPGTAEPPAARQEPTIDVTWQDGEGRTHTEVVPGVAADHAINDAPASASQAPEAINSGVPGSDQDALLGRALDAAGIEHEALQPAAEEAVAQRLAELEVEDSTTGLTPEQQAERETLAERMQELAAREAELEAIGESTDPVETAAEPAAGSEPSPAPALDGQAQAAIKSEEETAVDHFDPGAVQAKTWPQFVLERGERVSTLRKGTPAWDQLQSEWATVKTARAGSNPEGTGATGAPTPEIQNRDRSRPASVVQMQAMAQDPDYMRLGVSRSPETGAPMVFAVGDQAQAARALGRADTAVMSDGQRVPFRYAVMEAADVQPSNFADGGVNPLFDAVHPGTVKALNNGRTAGLRAAYERGTAGRYRQEFAEDAALHGIDPEVIAGMQAPVLVRLYSERDNQANMGAKSQSQALGLSATEQAATDAVLMDAGVLQAFEAGGLDSAANRDFARAFVGQLQAQGQDVAGMLDAQGQLSPAGVTRLQAALVHKAYGDGDLVESLFGSTDNDIRAIGEALKEVAGEWANMRHAAEVGAINPQVDVTGNLLQAIRMVQKARRERASLYDAIHQVDMVTGDVADPITVGVLRLLYSGHYLTRAVGRERLTESLRQYLGAALATHAAGDMFGEQVGPDAILAALSGQPATETHHAAITPATQQPGTAQGERGAPGGDAAGGRAAEPGGEARGQEPDRAGQSTAEPDRGGQRQDAQDPQRQPDGQGDQGAGQDGRGTVAGQAAPELQLTGQTPEQAREQAQQQDEAQAQAMRAEREAEQRAQADAERGDFALTGSDRAADVLEAQGQQPMFSRSADTRATYEARIDALFADGKAERVGVKVLDRSDVLSLLGHAAQPVVLAEGKVLQGRDNHPRMTAQVWKKIPEWLENPAAVFASDTVEGRLVFVAPEMVGGSPVRLIVEPNTQVGGLQVHLMLNAFDASGRTPWMRWAGDGLARYIDKKKFPAILAPSGLQLSRVEQVAQGTGRILSEKHLAGYRRANDPAFSFAGQQAATADQHALASAQQRLQAGEDAEAVRQETGWHKGADGKWRFEISDNDATYIGKQALEAAAEADPYQSVELPLGEVLDHPALFAAYPALRDVQVFYEASSAAGGDLHHGASYNARENVITLGNGLSETEQLSALLHEVQHGIQSIEGFATGSSPKALADRSADAQMLQDGAILTVMLRSQGDIGKAKELFERRIGREPAPGAESAALSGESPESMRARAEKMLSPQEQYRRQAGEVEARNTQARQSLTDEQRRATPPSSTADVADADVIVTFNGKEMADAPMPANAAGFDFEAMRRAVFGDAAAAPTRTPPAAAPGATTTQVASAIRRAYGNLLERLQAKGLVTLVQTEDEAVEAAAQARAAKTGQPVAQARASLMASVKNSVATGTDAFKRWFKDSKLVDAEGKPLVMYHGTSASQDGDAFASFDVYASNYGLMGMGGYFTADPAVASSYTKKGKGATPTVYPVYLSIQNPLDMDAPADAATWQEYFPDAGEYHEGGTTNESWYRAVEESLRDQMLPTYEGAEAMQDGLRAMGFDGITHMGGGRVDTAGVRHRVFIAFDPEQIKSATGNNGQFDPKNPDIRRSAAGAVEGFFDPVSGQSFLVADGLTEATAPGTLMHEVGVHMSADKVTRALFDRARTLVRSGADPFMRRVRQRMEAAGETSAEEAAAYIVTEYENDRARAPATVRQWVQDFLAAIRAWAYRHGVLLKADQLTPADIAAVARANARRIARDGAPARDRQATGRQPAGNRQAPAFARAGAPPAGPSQGRMSRLQQRAGDLLGYRSVDDALYAWQDKFIDLKRIQARIKALNGVVNETNDAYRGEELYHKRVAKRVSNFQRDEVAPLVRAMKAADVGKEELEQFLHARHAPEANRVLAERNPSQAALDAERAQADKRVANLRLQLQRAQAQGGAVVPVQKALAQALAEKAKWDGVQAFQGTEEERLSLSGMSDAEAAQIMGGLAPERRLQLDALAARVDKINEGTLKTLEGYGLMERSALAAWRKTYQHYVPLHRDEAHPDSHAHPIGQGFSTRGDAAKRRTGSNERVTNILAHVLMQREAALTRGEKNNVVKRLYLLAAQNPDPELWSLDAPKKKAVDPDTGLVRTMVDQAALLRDNVVRVRIGGQDRFIVFNDQNERTARLALAVKNLDAMELDRFTRLMGKLTRWFSAVNTQYNPVFGAVNIARDVQAMLLQLSNTPLAGKQGEVLKNVAANLPEIYRDLRAQRQGAGPGQGPWAQLWEQMQLDGGTTGYRELYTTPDDRVKALDKELAKLNQGKASAAADGIVGWLSDYNEALENTTRLGVYKAALDQGLSRQEAASIAKNITVNFNRKGRNTAVMGSWFAFLNAAIQGTTRMAETLAGPAGRKVMIGGVALGMLSAAAGMAMMGGGGADDEWKKIPEFVKERSVIVPLGRQDYVAIPMPLGFHVFPNIGRKMVEFATHDDPVKSRAGYLADMAMISLNAFNPLGGAENLMQMITPTPFDPVVAVWGNRDWTGRPIEREKRSDRDPTPGHARAKDAASQPARWVSRGINAATGGNEWREGAWSPTPDALDYLFGQLTGGVGRELVKAGKMAAAATTGEELEPHQIILAGRFYGNTRGANGQSQAFYENVKRINGDMAEAKGRVEAGEAADGVLRDVPLAPLEGAAKQVNKRLSELRKMRRQVQEQGGEDKIDQVKAINAEIEQSMYLLNQAVEDVLDERRGR